MSKLFTLCITILLYSTSFAQENPLKGTVKDQQGKPVSYATILVYYPGAADTLHAVADDKGHFVIPRVQVKKIGIKVSATGFTGYSDEITLTGEKLSTGIDVTLANKSTTLKEVTIEASKIQIKEDTVTYKVDSTMYKPNANVEDVIKKLPGLQVDKNGDITAQGKQVTKVKVNGKDFFGGDVKTATRELRADMVDNVQVIDDYGDQAAFTGVKDGEPSKTLNIQLKKDKNKGYFGNVTAGAGSNERYLASLSLHNFNNSQQISVLGNINNTNSSLFNFPTPGRGGIMRMFSSRGGMDAGSMSQVGNAVSNGDVAFLQNNLSSNDGISTTKSIGLNYRQDFGTKTSLYGSYSYSNRITDVLSNSTQTLTNYKNLQNADQTSNTDNHRAYFNLEYKLDSFNYIKFSPTVSYRKSYSDGLTDFYAYRNDSLKNSGSTKAIDNATAPNFSGSLLYNHRFAKRGRTMSVNLTAGNSSSDETQDNTTTNSLYALKQNISQDNKNHNWGVRVSYIEPLSKKRSLEFNYNYNNSFVGNEKITYITDPFTNGMKYSDSLSNVYDNEYNTHRMGVNFRATEKKYNYTIGMAVQPASIQSNSSSKHFSYNQELFNYFPVVRFAYNFSRSRSFNVNYSGSTSQPSYSQLQPVFDYTNPQYPTIGNPDLKPEFTNTISTRFNNFNFIKGNVFFGNLSFTSTNNKIVTNVLKKEFGVQETHYVNASGYYNANLFYLFSKPFNNRKYVLTLGGTANYNNNISYINSDKNTAKNWIVSQRVSGDINVKQWLETSTGVVFAINTTDNTNALVKDQLNNTTKGWNITHSGKIYFPAGFIFSYDLDKSFNTGYASNVNSDPFIINSYLEKQFLKKKNASIKLQGFDLLNENTNVSRSVTGSSITDTRTNKLGRYFLCSFIYRLNNFKGTPSIPGMGGRGGRMMLPGM